MWLEVARAFASDSLTITHQVLAPDQCLHTATKRGLMEMVAPGVVLNSWGK